MLAQVWWIAGKVLVLRETEVFVMVIAAFLAIRRAPHILIYIDNIDHQSNSIIFKNTHENAVNVFCI